MDPGNRRGSIEVSDGSRDAQHTVISARRQGEPAGCAVKQVFGLLVGLGDPFKDFSFSVSIYPNIFDIFEALALNAARFCHSPDDFGARVP